MAPASRRERKVVSVVFCDLVGFTQRAEQLDPEDVEALLDPYHRHLRSVLEHHGGTVEKFIGDAVMALFGAPVAHEDDPERAVRAALAIRDWAVEHDEVQVRLGVTTGEAVIRLDARPEAGEGMASGDVVNTAARLQAAAPVNGVLVDETTYRATRHVIEHDDAEPVEAKGKTAPIPVWQPGQARTRFGVDVAHQARAELVGRDRELAILRDAFQRAVHQRTPQLVTLVGVPGIGKSRLVYELSEIAREDPELITWRQGRCLAYGEGVTLWALGEIVKAQVGIVEQDTPTEVEAKIGSTVDALFDDSDASWVEQHLLALVGLAEESELGGDRRSEAFAAWRRFLERLAEQGPLVVVFEDLHWADESLLDFVDELVDWMSDVPLLVVGTARPELLERRPNWGGGKLNATTLALAPLTDEDTARLIAALLDRPVLGAESQQALLERAGGNPLYAEQFADLYVERGSADELALPETLQGIIAARLDGLPQREKDLLQEAAVVGKVFWAGGLRRPAEEAAQTLHSLERKGFVRRQRRSSVEGEIEFAFAHALVRDVAYGQIPRNERAEKHRRFAGWIESLGRIEDHAEMLAYHYGTALGLTRAAGADDADLVERTRLALRDAGDRAFGLNAFSTASSFYDQALALWPSDAERASLLYRFADALYLADDERADIALAEARDVLLDVEDWDTAAEAELALSRIWWHRGESERARAHERRAEELVGGRSSNAAARVLAHIGRTRILAGEHAEGLRLATDALSLAETRGITDVHAHALASIGLAKIYLGDPSGVEDEVRALEIATAANSPVAGAIANNVAVNAFFDFDFRRSGELVEEALGIAARIGDASGVRWLRGHRSGWAYMLGEWDAALRLADEFIAECEAGSPHYMETRTRIDRGRIAFARGDAEGAVLDFDRALTVARSISDPQAILPVLSAAYSAFEVSDRYEEAAPLLNEIVRLVVEHPLEGAITIAFEVGYTKPALDFERELREALKRAPPWKWRDVALMSLDGDFVGAADAWAEGGSPTFEARLRLRACEKLIESARLADAQQQAALALDFYRSVGARFFVGRLETLLPGKQVSSG
jgi:class 3 adenylate cyclase/tetratricopeptide (TPR) repeat protein